MERLTPAPLTFGTKAIIPVFRVIVRISGVCYQVLNLSSESRALRLLIDKEVLMFM
jgi:hypothetical protein